MRSKGNAARELGEKKSVEKNVTAAAFIALVVYFSTFVSRSLSDCQSAAPSAPSYLPLPLCALALKALHRKWLPTGPTRVPGGSPPPHLAASAFIHSSLLGGSHALPRLLAVGAAQRSAASGQGFIWLSTVLLLLIKTKLSSYWLVLLLATRI